MTDSRVPSGAASLGQGNFQQDGQQMGNALVFVNDYHPGVGVEVLSRLQQPTVDQILGGQDDGGVTDPTDYNGYVFSYTDCGPGSYNLLFIREETLQQDQTYSFTDTATFFSNQLQLVEVGIQSGGGGGTDGAGTNETDEANGDTADNETVDEDNETEMDDATEADNATEAGNDTVEVTNVTAGNQTDGNETG